MGTRGGGRARATRPSLPRATVFCPFRAAEARVAAGFTPGFVGGNLPWRDTPRPLPRKDPGSNRTRGHVREFTNVNALVARRAEPLVKRPIVVEERVGRGGNVRGKGVRFSAGG
jgi:hypothetical protein